MRPHEPRGWSAPHQTSAPADDKWDRSFRLLRVAFTLIWRTSAMRSVAALAFAAWITAALLLFGPVMYVLVETDSRLVMAVAGALAAYPFLVVNLFFSVALLSAAAACMDGRRLSVRESFAAATRRLPQILGWALLAAGVGALLDAIAEWLPGIGSLTSWLLGAAWSLATLFAVPIIALEGVGATAAARRSARVFRARWGESSIGVISVTVVATVPACFGCTLLGAGVAIGSTSTGVVLMAGGGLLLAATGFVATLVEQLFCLALYCYAQGLGLAGGYTEADVRAGMQIKPARKRRAAT